VEIRFFVQSSFKKNKNLRKFASFASFAFKKNKNMKYFYSTILFIFIGLSALAQQPRTLVLDLESTVQLAGDSSLSAFRAKNMYMASYWQYRTFTAERLPSIWLNMTPIRLDRGFVQRYDSELDIDVYRRQQQLSSFGRISARQNFDLTGGTFFMETELGYLRNFGVHTHNQFRSTPIRIGYQQDLIGFNRFRWERRIEPLRFQRAKQELISQLEQTAEIAAGFFFELAMAQAEYELAQERKTNTERMYQVGQERHRIAAIEYADLLSLRLDRVNAQNSLQNAEARLNRAMSALASFLNIDPNTKIEVRLPDYPEEFFISVEQALMHTRQNNPQYIESQQQLLESEQELDRRRREAMFNASISASVGFNQVADVFRDVFRNPLQQDIVGVTLSIPLVDWGVRRGRYNMARNNLNIVQLSAQQSENRLEEDVIMTVSDFIVQQQQIRSTIEAVALARMIYEQNQERFVIGTTDINRLTLSAISRQEAQQNYIRALQSYWQSYFKIRRLTLFDFKENRPIEVDFNRVGR
jgi:outer membrane protein TolC